MSRRLHAGLLRERITVEAPQHQLDELGGSVIIWQAEAVLWGYVESIRGVERSIADSRQSIISKRVIIRANDSITAAMRFIIGDAVHVVDAIMPHKDQPEFYECRVRLGGKR